MGVLRPSYYTPFVLLKRKRNGTQAKYLFSSSVLCVLLNFHSLTSVDIYRCDSCCSARACPTQALRRLWRFCRFWNFLPTGKLGVALGNVPRWQIWPQSKQILAKICHVRPMPLMSCSSLYLLCFFVFMEECLLGISVHSVVSREFSFLFFVPQCFLSCLFSLDVPFLVVSTALPCLVPFFSRSPSDRDELPLSSARDPSDHSTEDNGNRIRMTVRSVCIESRRTS